MTSSVSGLLYIVPTPIGNLEDITLRAVRVLGEVSVIACEDTRVTGFLLRHLGFADKRLISYFAGNERERLSQILRILADGVDVALVSDAGTPGISDPGARLVSAAVEAGVRVVSLPGPTAAITALVASGLPTDSVLFEGFLPIKKGRQTALRALADERRTIVLYESPHRIVRTLRELAAALGDDRRAVIGRELTKLHEEYARGTLRTIHDDFAARTSIRGEFVIVIAGAPRRRELRDPMIAESDEDRNGSDSEDEADRETD